MEIGCFFLAVIKLQHTISAKMPFEISDLNPGLVRSLIFMWKRMLFMKSEPTDIIYFYVSNPEGSSKTVLLHKEDCQHIINPLSRRYVGLFPNKLVAIERLEEKFPGLQSCKHCLED